MKKLLLFSLFIGIAVSSTTTWGAAEADIRIIVQAPHSLTGTTYIDQAEFWTFEQEQGDIYIGSRKDNINRVSFWRLHGENRNEPFMTLISYQSGEESPLPESNRLIRLL